MVFWSTAGIAAAVALTTGLVWQASDESTPPPFTGQTARALTLPLLQSGLIDFFSEPDYRLDKISVDQPELMAWLKTQGAPSALRVPENLSPLANLGCRVLEVDGRKVYILCFYLDGIPTDEDGNPMPGKRQMVVDSPDAPADAPVMMKPAALIHLVALPRDQFDHAPQVGDPVELSREGDWSFAIWANADVVYVAASPIEMERFQELATEITG